VTIHQGHEHYLAYEMQNFRTIIARIAHKICVIEDFYHFILYTIFAISSSFHLPFLAKGRLLTFASYSSRYSALRHLES
jgi:hypothetical protein